MAQLPHSRQSHGTHHHTLVGFNEPISSAVGGTKVRVDNELSSVRQGGATSKYRLLPYYKDRSCRQHPSLKRFRRNLTSRQRTCRYETHTPPHHCGPRHRVLRRPSIRAAQTFTLECSASGCCLPECRDGPTRATRLDWC